MCPLYLCIYADCSVTECPLYCICLNKLYVLISMQMCVYILCALPGISAEGLSFWEPPVCVCYHYYYRHKVRFALWEWLDCWVDTRSAGSQCCSVFPPSRPSFYTQDDGQAHGHVNVSSHVSSTSSCHNEQALEQLSASGIKCARSTRGQRPENGKRLIYCPLRRSTRSTQGCFILWKWSSTTDQLTWLMVC